MAIVLPDSEVLYKLLNSASFLLETLIVFGEKVFIFQLDFLKSCIQLLIFNLQVSKSLQKLFCLAALPAVILSS